MTVETAAEDVPCSDTQETRENRVPDQDLEETADLVLPPLEKIRLGAADHRNAPKIADRETDQRTLFGCSCVIRKFREQ